VVADVGVRIARGPDELVVGLQARLLLLLLLTRRRAGMNVRTTARAVHADQRVGTRVVIAATLVQVPHCNQPRRGSRDPDHVHSGAGGRFVLSTLTFHVVNPSKNTNSLVLAIPEIFQVFGSIY